MLSPDFNMNKKPKSQTTASSDRKRGRPTGKNRVPLSLEERRARNAQYERERRNEYADAMLELAEAIGCEKTVPNSDILANVLSYLQNAASKNGKESVEDLRRQNEILMSQIATLEERVNDQR